jgi:hypothetical protein
VLGNYTLIRSKKKLELNADLRTTKYRTYSAHGAKCTEFEVNPVCQIPRPPARICQSVLLHKVCADRESKPESPESQMLDTASAIANHSC